MVPHSLRHTAASLAISAGANIKVVQRMLGHKTATLTLDLYGHLFDEDLDPWRLLSISGRELLRTYCGPNRRVDQKSQDVRPSTCANEVPPQGLEP
ncbi:tyrosine-type recombinase/integrase [Nocardia sp. NPDC050718]|uniref:tyrosine-type recombinase/integrase n=1 Tax=Nocardia sp. NPDC050718 TaxID=3155788 RepID=UPI0033DD5C3C